ncbi:hypothetical protein SK128_004432 [Halocaridina rubra]|uniref:Centromere protein J C-terminal domain-containing protein n=1 Tax=Halocaridina rubra TaxID=373956 RepID=A0AAN8X104_HALRR
MDKGSHDLNPNAGCTETPVSALVERLMNLRKWQDEQLQELREKQIIIESPRCPLIDKRRQENTSAKDIVDNRSSWNSKTFSSSVEDFTVPSYEGNTKHITLESPQIEIGMDLTANENGCMDNNVTRADATCTSITGAVSVLSLPHVKRSDESISSDLCDVHLEEKKSISIGQKHNDAPDFTPELPEKLACYGSLSKLENDPNLNSSLGVSEDAKLSSRPYIPKNENDDLRVICGLSNFIKNHASIGGKSEATTDSEMPTKPKFTFLRKGQGTLRFGMRPTRLKSKLSRDNMDSSKAAEKPEETAINSHVFDMQTASSPTGKNATVRLKTYPSRISNRPQHTLQLKKKTDGSLNSATNTKFSEKPEGNRPIDLNLDPTPHADDINRLLPTSHIDFEKQGQKEVEELFAFEKLEELAEDSSFSSNCSTVVQLLRRGMHCVASTPVQSQDSKNQSAFKFEETGQDGPRSYDEEVIPQAQLPLISVSQILEQLKGIVRLEYSDDHQCSEEVLRTLVESFVDSDSTVPSEFISYFVNNIQHISNATSTPTICEQSSLSKPRVHFRPEGVEVLEYECSDTDENTLIETPSIVDDSDLVTTSDLEVLAGYDAQQNTDAETHFSENSSPKHRIMSNSNSASSVQEAPRFPVSLKELNREHLQPLKLQFSPPPQRPQNSASHYIWSIFGKERSGTKNLKLKGQKSKPLVNEKNIPNVMNGSRNMGTSEKGIEKSTSETSYEQTRYSDENQQDLEVYKTLLMTKVCELEKETESFKKENHKLKVLQESLRCEEANLEKERRNFEKQMNVEKKKFQEYIDLERNKLWKENQALKSLSPSVLSMREQSLETVYLKERLHDAEENAKKKESSHQFTVKKLNEKINAQDIEIRVLNEKLLHLQKIEKQNQHLKHELDRAKLSSKPSFKSKSEVNVHRNSKLKIKKATINNINKSLDKIHSGNTVASIPKHISESEQLGTKVLAKCKKINLKVNNKLEGVSDANHEEKSSHMQESKENTPTNDRYEIVTLSPSNSINVMDNEPKSCKEETEDDEAPLKPHEKLNIESTELSKDDGSREIIYSNGNKKLIYPDGSLIIFYYNGDRKEVYSDRMVYVYGTDSTRHTTYTDGKEILEFPNGQKEVRYEDGSSEITFTDNTKKTLMPDGTEICVIKDGTVIRTNSNGIKVFEFVSGQKEVHTPEEKRREYPDGTVKILYRDGRTETRYKKGRVRIKDKEVYVTFFLVFEVIISGECCWFMMQSRRSNSFKIRISAKHCVLHGDVEGLPDDLVGGTSATKRFQM